jgi:predicted AAA+ superfamily ATPase
MVYRHRILETRLKRYCQASYLVFRLRPWQANIGKRLVKRPKLYFWDTGLVCHLAGIRDTEAFEAGPLGGPVFENLLVAEILKGGDHRGFDLESYYFCESNGLEADLLLLDRDGRRRWIVDAKSGHTAKAPWTESLARVAALVTKAKDEISHAESRRVVIYRGETRRDWPTAGSDFLNFEEAIAEWQMQAK